MKKKKEVNKACGVVGGFRIFAQLVFFDLKECNVI